MTNQAGSHHEAAVDFASDVRATLDQTRAPSPDSVRAVLAEAEAAALAVGQGETATAYARAARALGQTAQGGRPTIDDSAAIAEVRDLLASRRLTLRAAIQHVGRARAPYSLGSFTRRMFRKIRAEDAKRNCDKNGFVTLGMR